MRPVIGITMDWEEKGTFSKRPYYALREHYFDIVYKAGGLPVAIPYIKEAINDYLDTVNGLLVPGGDFALREEWYINQTEDKPYKPTKRLEFDIEIISAVIKKDIPFLGICAGMQIMGGILGAKMTPNITKHSGTKIDHLNHKPAEEYAHNIDVLKGSLLNKITACENFSVNTAHIEAIISVPEHGIVVSGKSEDDVIEAIEIPNKKFALGVQWHPEFFMDSGDPNFKIVQALVEYAGK